MKPYLYIIMRNDLASFNDGKKMAHAAHAANAFVHKVVKVRDLNPVRMLYNKWAKETPQGFGTTICLSGTLEEFEAATRSIESDGGIGVRDHAGLAFGVVHDPSYPLRDGLVTHLIPLDTCAWFFGDKDYAAPYFSDFPLHK